jgi:hypothetical protein
VKARHADDSACDVLFDRLISSNVHAISGAPLAGAPVEVRGGARTSTDANGDFTLTVSPDRYQLNAAARGYAPLAAAVDANRDVRVQIALESLDSLKLRQIGAVSGRLAPIVGTIHPKATYVELEVASALPGKGQAG